MKTQRKHEGVVVPMVTPLTATGQVDARAVDRLLERLLTAKVNGVFVLGTTGEGGLVSRSNRRRLVEQVIDRVASRALVYAGIGDLREDDAVLGNGYLDAGADAVVARAPVSMSTEELEPWFRTLLDRLHGPMILYNIPPLTRVSVPLDVVDRLLGHPRLVGIKDSENRPDRLASLMLRYGDRPEFSIFVGVGRLMEQGLRLGAHGIVPSVGNLVPETCCQLWQCARRGDWPAARRAADRMNAVAGIYQTDRDLGESLSALKGALSLQRVCEPFMSPPLEPLNAPELRALAVELDRLHVTVPPNSVSAEKSSVHHSLQ